MLGTANEARVVKLYSSLLNIRVISPCYDEYSNESWTRRHEHMDNQREKDRKPPSSRLSRNGKYDKSFPNQAADMQAGTQANTQTRTAHAPLKDL